MPKDKHEEAQAKSRTKKLLENEIARLRSDAEVKQAQIDKKEVKIAGHESDIARLRSEAQSALDAADAIESDLLIQYTDDEPLASETDEPEPV